MAQPGGISGNDNGRPRIRFKESAPTRIKRNQRHIYILQHVINIEKDIEPQIGYFGYKVTVFRNIHDLGIALGKEIPGVIIMDYHFIENNEAAPLEYPVNIPCPVIYIANQDTIESRLMAVRACSHAFFTRPVDVNDLIDTIDVITSERDEAPFRVLIITDDFRHALVTSLELQGSGMLVSLVSNPYKITRPLVDFQPELILLDMGMSVCSGMELASVIRQQPPFVSIPIIFLSGEMDPSLQLNAINSGGDDVISKDISAEHLLAHIRMKVQRYRVLRSFMERDSLTGLLKHTRIKEQLQIEVARAGRRNSTLSFAMIDIDNFKIVNDSYGHLTGDRVLKSLARLLLQRLRKSDIVGRYGGEEFSVILPDTSGPDAFRIMEDVRTNFSKIRHMSADSEFYVTFSCGIATFPRHGDAIVLNETADRALYTAKEHGRNSVVLAD